MQSHLRFFMYICFTTVLLMGVAHPDETTAACAALTAFVVVVFEYFHRARQTETLSRLGLEYKEGKLYVEHTPREITYYDVAELKKTRELGTGNRHHKG